MIHTMQLWEMVVKLSWGQKWVFLYNSMTKSGVTEYIGVGQDTY